MICLGQGGLRSLSASSFIHIKDLKVKSCNAKQKLFEIITKFTIAQDNQARNTNILETDAELNNAFGHFHKVHEEYHGLLDDEEDKESLKFI